MPAMIRQDPMPVAINSTAPRMHASSEVSPIEPGVVPRKACSQETLRAWMPSLTLAVAITPREVAPLKPSTWIAVQMPSPVLWAG